MVLAADVYIQYMLCYILIYHQLLVLKLKYSVKHHGTKSLVCSNKFCITELTGLSLCQNMCPFLLFAVEICDSMMGNYTVNHHLEIYAAAKREVVDNTNFLVQLLLLLFNVKFLQY